MTGSRRDKRPEGLESLSSTSLDIAAYRCLSDRVVSFRNSALRSLQGVEERRLERSLPSLYIMGSGSMRRT